MLRSCCGIQISFIWTLQLLEMMSRYLWTKTCCKIWVAGGTFFTGLFISQLSRVDALLARKSKRVMVINWINAIIEASTTTKQYPLMYQVNPSGNSASNSCRYKNCLLVWCHFSDTITVIQYQSSVTDVLLDPCKLLAKYDSNSFVIISLHKWIKAHACLLG